MEYRFFKIIKIFLSTIFKKKRFNQEHSLQGRMPIEEEEEQTGICNRSIKRQNIWRPAKLQYHRRYALGRGKWLIIRTYFDAALGTISSSKAAAIKEILIELIK